jgi:hypothetical protein
MPVATENPSMAETKNSTLVPAVRYSKLGIQGV